MSEAPFAGLAEEIDRAAAAVDRLRKERDALLKTIEGLESRIARLEGRRREDAEELERLELLENERRALRERLTKLLSRLEMAFDVE